MRPLTMLATIALLLCCVPALAQENIQHAATEPLRDARIREDKIPDILLLAASAPYATRGMRSCEQIRTEIAKLNKALGPDVDTPGKAKGEGSAVAAAAAGEVVKSIIPGLGLVKVVTGADKQQRRVEAAVYAGSVRRGFLKGLGMTKNCPVPAAPTLAARAATPELPPPPKEKE